MDSKDQIRIAMWSGPRNISTAMMRSFENRDDTSVVDEPFYAYYLSQTGLDHPGRKEVLESQSTNWDNVVNLITGDIPNNKMIWYQKHMVHHIIDDKDIEWVKYFNNLFLIRHPKEVIISYSKQSRIDGIKDLGYPQQINLFNKIKNITGDYPAIFNSKDILCNPGKSLRAMCEHLKINFSNNIMGILNKE